MPTSKPIAVFIIALSILVGIGLGYWAWSGGGAYKASLPGDQLQIRADISQYKFINPLLYSEGPKDDSVEFNSLAASLSGIVASSTASGAASSVSVYFRDLNSGRWTGVNENDTYRPSSMLKVLAMMSALKLAESNPSLLSEKLHYTDTDHSEQDIKPGNKMASGDYSLQDLIRAMIIYSDNDALSAVLSDQGINQEFSKLYGIFQLPHLTTNDDSSGFMSPKSFSAVFRALYNSSLFEWDLSEEVLDLLSRTDFNDGLVAGVPLGTIVAHKFGEDTDIAKAGGSVIDRELHDCGIIYYPDHPYFLCVMTRGQSFTQLESVISAASKDVWDFVDAKGGVL